MNQPTIRRMPGHCACGGKVQPPLPICGDCYKLEQEKQRSRGRYGAPGTSWSTRTLINAERVF